MKRFLFWTALLFAAESGDTSTSTSASTSTITWKDDRKLQSSNPRVIAESFECDEYLREIEDVTTPRTIGHEIQICVQPSFATRNRGVRMRSIDDFTFYKSFGSAVQQVIQDRSEVGEKLTLVMCIPGNLMCSFKTRLTNEFFYSAVDSNITGTGTVSMEYMDPDESRRVLIENVPLVPRRRTQLQGISEGFAGFDDLSITVQVEGVPRPKRYDDITGEISSTWWQDAPAWLKALVIIGAILVVVMACCLCCMFFYSAQKGIQDEIDAEQYAEDDDADEYTSGSEGQSRVDIQHGGEDGTPTDLDVCFDADEHPGTVAMQAAVDATVLEHHDTIYCPDIYRLIKKQLPGRQFFVCDDENFPDEWRQVSKKELVDLIQKEYEDAKEKFNAFG